MRQYSKFCVVGIMIVLFVTVVVCVKIIKSDEPPTTESTLVNSTIYPILIPKYSSTPDSMVLSNESLINWEANFKRCGKPVEACPGGTNATSENDASAQNLTVKNSDDDFKTIPELCRCDDKCLKYGDCCATILTGEKKIPEETYWRCNRLLTSADSIRMISKCPPTYPDGRDKRFCEVPECPNRNSSAGKSLCPTLDVPVVNNITGDVYRNLFCAKCHSVSSHDLHNTNYTIICHNIKGWNKTNLENFEKRVVYHPGHLKWTDPLNSSVSCDIKIEELQSNVIKKLVPDVRFCRSDAIEECPLDLSTEENRLTYNLCASYTQLVQARNEKLYKNPHCAKCAIPDIDVEKDLKCHRARPRGPGIFRTTKLQGPVGINILFHFSLDMDDGYVGYSNKCEENEILDFIRHKCVPVICPKGYIINSGRCEKDGSVVDDDASEPPPILLPRNTTTTNSSGSENTNSSEPCFLIILHAGEYRELENGSLTVNKSGSAEGVLIFHPGEYQKYNESSMSICAENVDKTFEISFGPVISYISNVLLALSVFCSIAHIVLYAVLPKMRNLPGNNLLCLTASLLISQLTFLTLIKAENRVVCVMAAITMHYLFLASFCWMNIMSFDIWRTFSTEFLVRRYSGDSTKTFIKYSMFAWITPLLIVIVAIIADFSLPESLLANQDYGPFVKKLRPSYGHNNLCWIGQRLSLFVFFAFPVALIILCNLVLFTLTASTIWTQNKEGNKFINGNKRSGNNGCTNNGTNAKNGEDAVNGKSKTPLHGVNSGSTKKSDKIRFKLYAKLALIMGLTWIWGFLSGFTEWDWLWYPFVIFNGLQGTFIFISFDCKSKIWHMAKERCGWKKRKTRMGDTGEEATSSELTRRGTSSSTLRSLSTSGTGEKKKIVRT